MTVFIVIDWDNGETGDIRSECLETNVAVAVLGRPPALDMHLLFGGEAKPQEEAVLTCIARDLCPLPGVSSLPWNHKEMIRPNKINVI